MTSQPEDHFNLANDRPKLRPDRFENTRAQQRVLISGLDCLSGQQDLFPTDGEESPDIK